MTSLLADSSTKSMLAIASNPQHKLNKSFDGGSQLPAYMNSVYHLKVTGSSGSLWYMVQMPLLGNFFTYGK